MNVINAIPIVGWLIASVLCFFAAIPLYLLWNWLAPTYFYWLPAVYLDLPFWHVFGLIWLLLTLRSILLPGMSTTVTNEAKKEK